MSRNVLSHSSVPLQTEPLYPSLLQALSCLFVNSRRYIPRLHENTGHPLRLPQPLPLPPACPAVILPRSSSPQMCLTPCHASALPHLAQDVCRVCHPWSVASCQVPKVSDGIRRV